MTRSKFKKQQEFINYTKNLTALIEPKARINLEAKKRTIEDIKSEFINTCARAGNAEFQIVELKKEIEQLQENMRKLNAEATELSKEEKASEPAGEQA